LKYRLGHEGCAVFAVPPHHVEERDKLHLRRTIARYARSNSGNPRGIAEILLNATLAVAQHDGTVGSDLMVASFPRVALPADQVIVGNEWRTSLTTLYVASSGEGVQYMPIMVMRNGVILTDVEVRPISGQPE
jgi:hypothetical protein